MLRECGLAHKTIVFVLDEFDLFAQVRLPFSDIYFSQILGPPFGIHFCMGLT